MLILTPSGLHSEAPRAPSRFVSRLTKFVSRLTNLKGVPRRLRMDPRGPQKHNFEIIGIIWGHFRKTLIFPIDFNDFMQLWGPLDALRSHFGATWTHFGVTLAPL